MITIHWDDAFEKKLSKYIKNIRNYMILFIKNC